MKVKLFDCRSGITIKLFETVRGNLKKRDFEKIKLSYCNKRQLNPANYGMEYDWQLPKL